MPTLLSVNVGLPADVAWDGRTVHTGIWKRPVDGPRLVRRLNVEGDGQGDLAGHGGEQRAVLVYQIDSYRYWQQQFGQEDFELGQFGENFTVDGLPDDEVCIGDRYRIGEAEFEVTQPRVTCYRVGLRLGQPELPAMLVSHHRPGFYLRVITEGRVQAGDQIERVLLGPHALSVAAIDALLYLPDRDTELLRKALDIPALSPGWQQSFRELLDVAEGRTPTTGPVTETGSEPAWDGFRRLRVSEVVAETSSVISVLLGSEDGGALPRPHAGQYLTVRVTGAGDPAPVRSYSLSATPDDAHYRISIKTEPGGVSSYLQTHLHPGSVLEVAAPRGAFVLTDSDEPVLLVSAGIGVTPVLAMLHQLAAQHSGREVWWIQTSRSADDHAFAAEAHDLLSSLPRSQERLFFTAPDAQPIDDAQVVLGRPTFEALDALGLPVNATAYICGPRSFMTDLQQSLTRLGLAPDRLRTELFGALAASNPGVVDAPHVTPHPPAGPAGPGPSVTFVRSGLTVPSSARQASLLELAEACDVPTRWSCRSGVCHTCVTPILSGDISYAPSPLEMPAAGSILICCAHPESAVVLDL